MIKISELMSAEEGETAEHGEELKGAAKIMNSWIKNIES